MKKLYYFSKSKLQFVEIRNYKSKLITYFSLSVLIFSSLVFGSYFIISSMVNPGYSLNALRAENGSLKEKLLEIADKYKALNIQLNSLIKVNNDLRIAANLSPISDEERQVGVGGGSYDNSFDFLNGDANIKLKQALAYVDEVSRKIDFEKSQFEEISNKLKENKKLYAAIPAIQPCTGSLSGDGFGMRMHPILHVRRMHDGIDIVTGIGTPVHAPGNGVVEFVGRRGGFGLAIEINHGFGYETIYAHLSKVSVKRGQKVYRGDIIGKTGTSGLSTGPHLHYEVHHDGIKENPKNFFFDDLGFFELSSNN